jgi:hypothetical protein
MVYTLVDQQGVLKLQLCAQGFSMDLKTTPQGNLVFPESALGEIELLVASPAEPGVLRVRFGGEVCDHVRLRPEQVDQARFRRDFEGRYVCADLNATATITRAGDVLEMTLRDGFAQTVGPVDAMGQDVAALGATGDAYACAISLIRQDGEVRGFHLNSGRTRHLAFLRA